MDSKSWYLSKSIWLSLVGGILSSVSVIWPHANVITSWISLNLGTVGMVWGVLGVIVRAVTKGSISLSD